MHYSLHQVSNLFIKKNRFKGRIAHGGSLSLLKGSIVMRNMDIHTDNLTQEKLGIS